MKLLEGLQWRYATKKFDPSKKVNSENIQKIKQAIQLSASSYGLQLYKVFVIEDADLREKLKPASWNQPQITDASHLFVFCNYVDNIPQHIDSFVELKAKKTGKTIDDLKGYGDFIKGKMAELTAEQIKSWTGKQTYIALANLLAACGELKIDACPMEGFEAAQYDEILGLQEKGLSAAVLATVGYRSDEDATKDVPKVRKSMETLFEVH